MDDEEQFQQAKAQFVRKLRTLKKADLIDEAAEAMATLATLDLRGLMREVRRLGVKSGVDLAKEMKSLQATLAALKRHADDPIQTDRQMVRECWDDWQADPGRYRSQAAFARDMVSKWGTITDPRTVETWCREWGKDSTAK